ncbi:hypothetical protein D3C87_382730 [compost metagenome]
MVFYFLNLLMIKMIKAMMATTIKMPTPTPRLKIPSTTSQLEKERSIKSIMDILDILFMVSSFLFL